MEGIINSEHWLLLHIWNNARMACIKEAERLVSVSLIVFMWLHLFYGLDHDLKTRLRFYGPMVLVTKNMM